MQGKCPDDYVSWLETMYCLFGNKWSKLHRGPATGYERIEQGELPKHAIHNPVEVLSISVIASVSYHFIVYF